MFSQEPRPAVPSPSCDGFFPLLGAAVSPSVSSSPASLAMEAAPPSSSPATDHYSICISGNSALSGCPSPPDDRRDGPSPSRRRPPLWSNGEGPRDRGGAPQRPGSMDGHAW